MAKWMTETNKTQPLVGMNRYLCSPDELMLNGSFVYHFTRQLSHISIYTLPLFALAGNSLTLLVMLTNARLNRSSFSVYVKSMAISDTLVLVLKWISFENKTSKHFYWSSMCTVLIFLSEASVLISVWTIVLITIERTLVVLFPLHIKKLVSAYQARVLVILLAVVSVIFSARILLIPIDDTLGRVQRCQPVINWQTYRQLNATITEFAVCFVPVAIVIVCNCLTLYTVKRALVQRHLVLTNQTYQMTKRKVDSNEHQLMLMLFVVTIMFIVYFVPFTITNVIYRWGLPFKLCFTSNSFAVFLVIRAVSEFLKDLNFCTNFIIYCVSGRRFRYALVTLVRRRTFCSSSASEERNDGLLQAQYQKSFRSLPRHTFDESQF